MIQFVVGTTGPFAGVFTGLLVNVWRTEAGEPDTTMYTFEMVANQSVPEDLEPGCHWSIPASSIEWMRKG